MWRLSMDQKVMPRTIARNKYILVMIYEFTNSLICIPVYFARSEEVGEILIEYRVAKYGCPDVMIMEWDRPFISLLMNYLSKEA